MAVERFPFPTVLFHQEASVFTVIKPAFLRIHHLQAKAAAAANTTNQTAAGAAGGEEEEEEEEEELSCGPSDPEAMNKVRTCSFWMEGVALCITGEWARSIDLELRTLLTT